MNSLILMDICWTSCAILTVNFHVVMTDDARKMTGRASEDGN